MQFRWLALCLIFVSSQAHAGWITNQSMGTCKEIARLSGEARAKLALMSVATPQSPVRVDILTERGCGAALAQVSSRAIDVLYRDDKLGYASLVLPFEGLRYALETPGIESVSFPREFPDYCALPQTQHVLRKLPPLRIPIPTVSRERIPSDGPYFPADEAGLTELWKEYPTGDGRGVTIAFLDEGVDLLHPALQTALAGDGRTVPKVQDFIAATRPSEDSAWVEFHDIMQSRDRKITWKGHEWDVPYDGRFAIGLFARRLIEIQRHPEPEGVALVVGVLWDQEQNKVWVDTGGDFNFSTKTPLTDYGLDHEIGFFGEEDGNQDNRVPFGIKINRAGNSIRIFWGGAHGAMAGPLAMNRRTGGLVSGAAPESQIVDAYTANEPMAAFLTALARPDVDLISRSGGVLWNDQEFDRALIQRALNEYAKPLVCYCNVPGSIDVQDWQSGEMLRRNRHLLSISGPAVHGHVRFEPGGLVNTVLAPSSALITESRYAVFDQYDPIAQPGLKGVTAEITGPSGYQVGSNASPTVPIVAGILGDLISLARRNHVRYTSQRLADAIFTSAELLPDFPVSQQGHGRVNAFAAWQQLQRLSLGDDANSEELAHFSLEVISRGKRRSVFGFARNETPGRRRREALWITKRGGTRMARLYRLRIKGDSFVSLANTSLWIHPSKPAELDFNVERLPGDHLAFIQLMDQTIGAVVDEIPVELRVTDNPAATSSGVDRYAIVVPPRQARDHFIASPKFAEAVGIDVAMPDTGRTLFPESFLLFGKHMLQIDRNAGRIGEHDSSCVADLNRSSRCLIPVDNDDDPMWVHISNRSEPEYETRQSPAAPKQPITADIGIARYAVALRKSDQGHLAVWARFADLTGTLSFLKEKSQSFQVRTKASSWVSESRFSLGKDISAWQINLTHQSNFGATIYLAYCDREDSCALQLEKRLSGREASLTVPFPRAGSWKLLLLNDHPSQSVLRCNGTSRVLTRAAPGEEPTITVRHRRLVLSIPNDVPRRHLWAAFYIARSLVPGVQVLLDLAQIRR